jgi:PST family polysaccharide transporter
MVVRTFGLEAAGHYAAAYSLSAIYAGFILQAMGADFFPRLAAVAQDDKKSNRLVNEQVEISLLLATPGLLFTLALAPWVIRAFYAKGFDPAILVLRWQALGALCRVGTWPMTFILVSKGERRTYIWTEFAMSVSHVIFLFIGLKLFGLPGSGMAFFEGCMFHWGLVVIVVKRISGFSWSRDNTLLAAWMLPLVALTFGASMWLPAVSSQIVGMVIATICSYFSVRLLVRKVPDNRIARMFAWLP